jgi:acyl-CoA reductase-like NAD-dependent aldehyde dehydrogenase
LQTGKTITNSTSEVSEAFNVMEKHLTYKLENDGQLREGYTL